ncbi:hypothetical protein GCM10009830_14210 [Glycomyces endophyticus]|uniref:Uncharacterized protein n=1 Tax=Glycomyces endophyticus TaxID=480996 RepID=A0ABN2GDM2_9ACTN
MPGNGGREDAIVTRNAGYHMKIGRYPQLHIATAWEITRICALLMSPGRSGDFGGDGHAGPPLSQGAS